MAMNLEATLAAKTVAGDVVTTDAATGAVTPDELLRFVAFNRVLDRQFELTQRRWADRARFLATLPPTP